MTIRDYQGKAPKIAKSAYVDESAVVIGNVTVGEDSSLWPMVVVRGDVHSITIGARTNIQDGCILHVTHDGKYSPGGFPLNVGDEVTVGHRVTLHACTVGNNCLIGMSATIMDGAVLLDKVMLGAGSLVPSGKELETGCLYMGTPVKKVRSLTDKELAYLEYSAKHYVKMKNLHMEK